MSDPLWPRPTVTGQAPVREAESETVTGQALVRDTAEGVSVRHTPDQNTAAPAEASTTASFVAAISRKDENIAFCPQWIYTPGT